MAAAHKGGAAASVECPIGRPLGLQVSFPRVDDRLSADLRYQANDKHGRCQRGRRALFFSPILLLFSFYFWLRSGTDAWRTGTSCRD